MATTDAKLLLDDIIAAGAAQTYSPVDPSQLTTSIPGAGDGVAIAGLAIPVAGDTVQTLVVGLAGDDDKAVDAGRLFVVTEDAASATAISYTIDGVTAGDAAGAAVATIADLDGDGLREIIVGAPGADNGAALNAGQTYVVWGQTATGGVDLGDASGDNGNGYSIFGEAAGDASGAAVAAIADGNGDGRQEVLVGAAGNDAGGVDAGAAYVVFGRANGATDVSLSSLGSKGFKIIGEDAGDAAGRAVAGIGDQNHDGKGDILVGAVGNDAGGNDAGAAYVVFNKSSTAAVNLDNVALGVGGYKIVGQAGEGAGASVADIDKRIEYASRTLRIAHLLDRKTDRLSGGEMQRVSIGRAIVREPQVFLMDEPLSALDAKLRESLRSELKDLQMRLGATFIFVTHDQVEAMTMGDRIGVLNGGRIIQVGTPYEIYNNPRDTFVAGFVGSPAINLLPGEASGGKAIVVPNAFELPLGASSGAAGGAYTFGVRPEDVRVESGAPVEARVHDIENHGIEKILTLRAGSILVRAGVPARVEVKVEDTVRFGWNADKVIVFDRKTGANLRATN